MDTPKSQKLEIVIPAFRIHSQNFFSVLEGITEEMAAERNGGKTNHVLWMAGNIVNDRYWIAEILGMDEKDPHNELFTMGKAIDDSTKYPSLDELKKNFADISPKLYEKLLNISDEELAKNYPMDMNIPFVKENVLNMVGMFIGREDYLLGQIGLMRKLLGLKGMSHDFSENIPY